MPTYTREQLATDGLPFIMAYLVAAARQHSSVTYGKIAEGLQRDLNIEGRIFSTQIGQPVGVLMERIQSVHPRAPLINLLAINQSSGVAGKGADDFLAPHFSTSSEKLMKQPEVRKQLINQALADVYAYQDWDAIARQIFGQDHPAFKSTTEEQGTEIDKSTTPGQPRGGEAESAEHKALKERIAADPLLVGAPREWLQAATEFVLRSGDEADVCITSLTEIRLVEVKSRRSNAADLERGIYQCVKYRAVYEAMRIVTGAETSVVAVLATEMELPSHLAAVAQRLKIVVKVVS